MTGSAVSGTGSLTGSGQRSASPLSALRRIATRPPPDPDVETCDMCAEVIGEDHPHVVDIESRQLMCTCRGCMLLFTAETAHLRYRAVPDRYLSFPDFDAVRGRLGRARHPGRSGVLLLQFGSRAPGRLLSGSGGRDRVGARPGRLVRRAWPPTRSSTCSPMTSRRCSSADPTMIIKPQCFLVPIDACYEFAGRLRQVWRGFDGGQDARAEIAGFFARVSARSRPRRRGPAG